MGVQVRARARGGTSITAATLQAPQPVTGARWARRGWEEERSLGGRESRECCRRSKRKGGWRRKRRRRRRC
eukprot:jgi/Mesen1/10256/ME000778S09598